MFDNIKKAKTKVENQQVNKSGEITKKQRGRPMKPNMKTVQIRLHNSLNKKLKNYSNELGVAKSQLISIALESYLSKQDKRYKLVEV